MTGKRAPGIFDLLLGNVEPKVPTECDNPPPFFRPEQFIFSDEHKALSARFENTEKISIDTIEQFSAALIEAKAAHSLRQEEARTALEQWEARCGPHPMREYYETPRNASDTSERWNDWFAVSRWLQNETPEKIVQQVVQSIGRERFEKAYSAVVAKGGGVRKLNPPFEVWEIVETFRRARGISKIATACKRIELLTSGLPRARRVFAKESRGKHATAEGIRAAYYEVLECFRKRRADSFIWMVSEEKVLANLSAISAEKLSAEEWLIRRVGGKASRRNRL